MDYRYISFDPKKSQYATELLNNLDSSKYVTKKQGAQKKFFDCFKSEIYKMDDEGYLKNPYLFQIQGPNLNYVATQLLVLANKLKDKGYQLNLDAVVGELDMLFKEFSNDIDTIYDDFQKEITTPVTQFSKDISYFYVNQILKPAISKSLENNCSYD